jgi:hypothetical protein
MMREDERDRVARQGMQAWARLKKGKSWTDWLQVGEALQVGREWAMHQAGVNKPEGKGYNTAFGEWLTKYKLDDMDKGDRSRLFSVMDNLPAIEEWRQRLTLTEKLALNHPQAVLRRWKAFIEPGKPKSDKPTLRDGVVSLSEENEALKGERDALKAHVTELEAARDASPAPKGNPLKGLDFGRIVDFILDLPSSTVKAVTHDLVRVTTEKAAPQKRKAQKKPEPEAASIEEAETIAGN